MKSRVTGIQKNSFFYYQGLELLPLPVFYFFSLSNPQFLHLFDEWVLSGYEMRLTPSPDRIDPNKGYEIENIEWVTFEENLKRRRSPVFKNNSTLIQYEDEVRT